MNRARTLLARHALRLSRPSGVSQPRARPVAVAVAAATARAFSSGAAAAKPDASGSLLFPDGADAESQTTGSAVNPNPKLSEEQLKSQRQRTKRIYERVHVKADVPEPHNLEFTLVMDVLLPGKPGERRLIKSEMKTPDQQRLVLPNNPICEAIRDEWNQFCEGGERESKHIDPSFMPLTSLACTTVDLIENYTYSRNKLNLREGSPADKVSPSSDGTSSDGSRGLLASENLSEKDEFSLDPERRERARLRTEQEAKRNGTECESSGAEATRILIENDPSFPGRQAAVARLIPYLETDTLCFVGGSEGGNSVHETLIKEQERLWTPLRAWFEKEYGVKINVSEGILLNPQPQETIDKIRDHLLYGCSKGGGGYNALDEEDDNPLDANPRLQPHWSSWALASLEVATGNLKSLMTAMSLLEGRISPHKAAQIADLEENVQMERWGQGDPAWQQKQETQQLWLKSCQRFREMLP